MAEAIDLNNGSVIWFQQIFAGNPPESLSFTILHGTFYITGGHDLMALRASGGHLLWQIKEKNFFVSVEANA